MARTSASNTTELTEADLIAGLKADPDLLRRHPQLLAELNLPELQDSVSLQQFQLRRLRSDNQALQLQLRTLSEVASQNEQLMRRLHRVTLALCAIRQAAELVNELVVRLKQDFQADAVCLHTLSAQQGLTVSGITQDLPESPDPWLAQLLSDGVIQCGRFTQDKLSALFPNVEPRLRSAAVLPIEGVGLLAIGAQEEHRFQPDMGVLFLELLAITLQHGLGSKQAT